MNEPALFIIVETTLYEWNESLTVNVYNLNEFTDFQYMVKGDLMTIDSWTLGEPTLEAFKQSVKEHYSDGGS